MLGGAYSCNRLQGKTLNLRSTRKVPKSQTTPYPKTKESILMTDETNDPNIPQPVTSNGWSPAEHFNPENFEEQDFLVWIVDKNGNGSCMVSQWHPAMDFEGNFYGEPRFNGEWRQMDGLEDIEPVAFRALPDGPDLGGLKKIVEAHHKKAA